VDGLLDGAAHVVDRRRSTARGRRVAIAAARFTTSSVSSLREGVLSAWRRTAGLAEDLVMRVVRGRLSAGGGSKLAIRGGSRRWWRWAASFG